MKYAVVTGSTQGIGKAVAKKLLGEGYFVIGNYAHNDAEAQACKAEMEAVQGEEMDSFQVIKQELSNYENVLSFVEKIRQITDKVDVVVLNVGVTDRSTFQEITQEKWDYVINTNLSCPFFLIQKLDPMLQKNGSIVFMGSAMGIYPHSISIAYGATKSAVHFLTKQLVKEFAGRKINVNAVAPGFVDTSWQKNKPADQRARIEEKTALKRFAEPEEVASLCMEAIHNRFINGAVLEIHGGYCYK